MKHRIEISRDIEEQDLVPIMSGEAELVYDDASRFRVDRAEGFLKNQIQAGKVIYGVNTGFGSFCEVRIDSEKLASLQENLILSHACGIGELLPVEISRLMLASKISSLSRGHSGISSELMESLISLFNNNLIPAIPEQGSLGASGDLAPLAHMSLPLLGKGQLHHNGKLAKSEELLKQKDLEFKALGTKEGLALLNGTQYMSASLAWSINAAYKLQKLADIIGATSALAWNGRLDAFYEHSHRVRRHEGQRKSAARICHLLSNTGLASLDDKLTQDPYSFRCMPQVHGASLDNIDFVRKVVLDEINSVTDNPIIFSEEELVISGGNFHGQYLALAADQLKLALSELGSISERRVFNLLSGKRGLPDYLTDPAKAGLNSGLMIPQYTAASLVSQNKQLCTPASVDSITSSNGQEDHVSMGANACIALRKVVENTYYILAIELLNASQAIDFRLQMPSHKDLINKSATIMKIHSEFRESNKHISKDRVLHEDILASRAFLESKFLELLIKDL